MRTQVGIVGAGPAGLLLSHLLHLEGIESVVLEARSREYVEHRVRAGVLEQGTVELLDEAGLGDRLHREALVHHGIELRFDGEGHRIDLAELTGGRTITIYGQQEVVKDLIAARLATAAPIRFEVADVALDGLTSDAPSIAFTHAGERQTLECDVVAGCDGFHGICRPAIPDGVLTVYERDLSRSAGSASSPRVAPSSDELIYANHERGFALLQRCARPRSRRMYLQCEPDEDIDDWSDDRIWDELHTRLRRATTASTLQRGADLREGRHRRCAASSSSRCSTGGCSSPATPRTSCRRPAPRGSTSRSPTCGVLVRRPRRGSSRPATPACSTATPTRCLRRVWRVQHFSWWMTSMLHRFGADPFQHRLQLSELQYVTSSTAAATTLAENYVGLPL